MNFDITFQGQLVKSLLQNPDFVGLYYDLISVDYFEDVNHRLMVQHILDFFHRYRQVPSVIELISTFKNVTEKNSIQQSLRDIFAYDGNLSSEYAGDQIVDFAKTQSVKLAYAETGDSILAGDYSRVKQIWDKALLVGTNRLDMGISFFSDDGFERRLNYTQNTNIVPTIWSTINQILGGGSSEGELHVVVSPPNGGKSTVLMNVGLGGLLSGKFVVHVSTEMSDIKTAMRYDARISGIPKKKLLSDPDRYKELVMKSKVFYSGDMVIKSYPPGVLTNDELYGYLATVQRVYNRKIDLIIVDYPDEMVSKRRYNGREDKEAGEIFEGLRYIAGEFRCPVWTATQGKRLTNSHKKWQDWQLSDLSESWDKAKKPDFIMVFHQNAEDYVNGIGYFVFLKVRDDEKPVYPLKVAVDFSTHKLVQGTV